MTSSTPTPPAPGKDQTKGMDIVIDKFQRTQDAQHLASRQRLGLDQPFTGWEPICGAEKQLA